MAPLRILVTGAAGLIGGAVCAALAERGHAVIGLVHRSRDVARIDGTRLDPPPFAGGVPEPGFARLGGDVREPGLGLCAGVFAGGLDRVVHCAAVTDFAAAPAQYRAVNVDGAAHVAAFARAVGAGLVHVSTAYVCGERSGPIPETVAQEARFANGYEASKAAGEAAVRAVGVPTAFVRPSIVVGRAADGALGRFENIYAFLKLIGSGRIATLPAAPDATLDLVPIDHVVGGLVDATERFAPAAGRVFHLVSGSATPVSELVAHDYPGFRVPRLVVPERFDAATLPPMEAYLHAGVTAHFASYLRRDPRFAADNLAALSGRVCPPTGPGFLRRLVAYAVEAGYLVPDPALIARRGSGAPGPAAGPGPSARRP